MVHYVLGFLLGLTPAAWMLHAFHYQPCGLQQSAWQECRKPSPPGPRWPKPTTNPVIADAKLYEF